MKDKEAKQLPHAFVSRGSCCLLGSLQTTSSSVVAEKSAFPPYAQLGRYTYG